MRIISVINQKGGVGKTTCVANLGDALSRKGKKVLMLDLDPQAHLTVSLGVKLEDSKYSIHGVLTENIPFKDTIQELHKNLFIAPSHLDLAGAEMQLYSVTGRELLLQEALRTIANEYDFIFIDCPPSLGLLTINALVCSQEVFIPLQTEFLALQGTGKLYEVINVVKQRLNPNINITGVIATRYSKTKNLNKKVIELIREAFNNTLFNTFIRENIKLAECPSFGKTIFDTKPVNAPGIEDFNNLADEVLKQGE